MDSPQKALKAISQQIRSILRGVDVRSLDRQPREMLLQLDMSLAAAQKYAKDLAAAEFWNEREPAAAGIVEQAQLVNAHILELSSYDIFGPTDVAQLGAQLDMVVSQLR